MSFLLHNLRSQKRLSKHFVSHCAWLQKFVAAFCPSVAKTFFVLRVMSCAQCQGTERGLAIITPRVALIRISQGNRVERESNRKVWDTERDYEERQKPKRKEFEMEEKEGGRERESGYERLRDAILQYSLWSLSRGTRGDGIPRRTPLKFIQPH